MQCHYNLIMEKQIKTLSDWIEYKEIRGYYTFTKEDIERQFPAASKVYIKTALHRLVARSRIISPWRNFYVIIPVEYSLKGIIPPVFYMNQLMAYLDKSIECSSLLWSIPSKSPDIFRHGGTTVLAKYFKKRNPHSVLFKKRNPDGICKETQDTDRLHQCIFS